jgi:hypothetical protein
MFIPDTFSTVTAAVTGARYRMDLESQAQARDEISRILVYVTRAGLLRLFILVF